MSQYIKIRGADENNLKHIDVDIPRNAITVVTGVSGSGKSSLIIDTLQQESMRQLFDTMGNTDHLRKPSVRSIQNLSPSICVDQHITNKNPRSTVGTASEVLKYLRWLYANAGTRVCQSCGHEHAAATLSQKTDLCEKCGKSLPSFRMSDFSFNSPRGACPVCHGLGMIYQVNENLVIDETRSILDGAVKTWGKNEIKHSIPLIQAAARHYGFAFDPAWPVADYPPETKAFFYYGYHDEKFTQYFPHKRPPRIYKAFHGFVTDMQQYYQSLLDNEEALEKLKPYMIQAECPVCHGTRFSKELDCVLLAETPISGLMNHPLHWVREWIDCYYDSIALPLERSIVQETIEIIRAKLDSMIALGLDYLTLSRSIVTLSHGESQRLRLAQLLTSNLTEMIYILDEPTIGLHPPDINRIITAVRKLKEAGNTVIIVEHDLDMIRQADYIVEIGPEAGKGGGQLLFQGTIDELAGAEKSVIAPYLSQKRQLPKTKQKQTESISVVHAHKHNILDLSAHIKLNCLNVVTGVSGSGKSTLVFDILLPALEARDSRILRGLEQISSISYLSQKVTTKSARSNVATYTKIYTAIRELFGNLPETKQLHLDKGDFSFNVKGGRCEQCEGTGITEINMVLMPTIRVTCPVCQGKRFQEKVLQVKYKGHTISDILYMSCQEAAELFDTPRIKRVLDVINQIGLGYLTLGHPLNQLSGGELQRLKLVKELSQNSKEHTLYIFDEPTTGLHPRDVERLMTIFRKLLDQGHTLLVIEHDPDIMLQADHIIDLGPGAGERGGKLLYEGDVAGLLQNGYSITGKYLKQYIS